MPAAQQGTRQARRGAVPSAMVTPGPVPCAPVDTVQDQPRAVPRSITYHTDKCRHSEIDRPRASPPEGKSRKRPQKLPHEPPTRPKRLPEQCPQRLQETPRQPPNGSLKEASPHPLPFPTAQLEANSMQVASHSLRIPNTKAGRGRHHSSCQHNRHQNACHRRRRVLPSCCKSRRPSTVTRASHPSIGTHYSP